MTQELKPQSPDAPSVVVVADDLTGATDSSVQFAYAGWKTQLLLSEDSVTHREPGAVSALVTDARALTRADAQNRTRAAVLSGHDAATRLYLKIDSTMRGTISSQIDGALEAWQQDHPGAFALVCPAYPAMGRTVSDGQMLVNGTPVQDTVIGRDPVTPVSTSSLSELLPGSATVTKPHGETFTVAALVASIRTARASSPIIIIDAGESADLDVIAEAAVEFGDDVVPVGSAGLAAALAVKWGTGLVAPAESDRTCERVIIVASSLHTVTREQVQALVDVEPPEVQATEVTVLTPDLTALSDEAARSAWLETVSSTASTPIVIVDAPEERTSSTDLVADLLAGAAATLMRDSVPTSLMLLGGEGARAVLNRLGAVSLHIHSTVREGMPIGAIEGGRAHGATVITKAGGFGRRSDVLEIAAELLHNNEGSTQ